jgi:hypothetical protein
MLDFDGGNDRLLAPVSSSLAAFQMGTSDYTIELWLKKTRQTVRQNLVTARHSNQADRYIFFIESTNKASFYVNENPNFAIIASTTSVTDGNWHHVAVVRDYLARTLKVYVDGALENTVTVPGTGSSLDLNQKVAIGNDYYPGPTTSLGNFFLGQMDDLRFWSKAKTLAEIQAEDNIELSGTERDLAVYYNFNQGIAGRTNTSISTAIAQTSTLDATLTSFALTGSSSNFVETDLIKHYLQKEG